MEVFGISPNTGFVGTSGICEDWNGNYMVRTKDFGKGFVESRIILDVRVPCHEAGRSTTVSRV